MFTFKEYVKRTLPSPLVCWLMKMYAEYISDFSIKAYSQEGEDMILRRVFVNQRNGFYIDIGAHHPRKFSNTYLFYKLGWSGINVDATPGSMKRFKRARPRDINIEAAIGDERKTVRFYLFDEPALNTFNQDVAHEWMRQNIKLVGELTMETITLTELLNQYLPRGKIIDFMSVDVEGNDLQVLRSNTWNLYRPRYLLVESVQLSLSQAPVQNEIRCYLSEQGYELFAKTVNTATFKDASI